MRLDLKYRPQTFDDLIGQPIVARHLKTLIRRAEPRQILLHGPFGSGKTSACRIYARALHCEKVTGEGSPCNACDPCRSALGKSSPDYMEVSGAECSIETIREIEQIARLPSWGRHRVVNIDECQGLAKEAFDVLLKVLEEPPPFLVFIFTTTELANVNPAVRSRCQKLEVNLLDHATALAHLQHIVACESIVSESAALELIAYISRGHPRDLLKNLEQAMLLGDVTLENTRALFSLDYIVQLTALWRALLANDSAALRAALHAWPADPAAILNTWREFLLFLLCRQGGQARIAVDPMFAHIPEVEIAQIVSGLTARAAAVALSLEQALVALMGMSDTVSMDDPLQLELWLFDLADRLNGQAFAAVRNQLPASRPQGDRESEPAKPARRSMAQK